MTHALLAAALAAPGPAPAADEPPPTVRAEYDRAAGTVRITEAGRPVLVYRYRTVGVPEGLLDDLAGPQLEYARKYAIPRSDYLHPLCGPDGGALTADWNSDHPHHRGIYWAWPEVRFRGETGDLHALQRVWARPTGRLETRHGDGWAGFEAENRWMWEDRTPIVRETATIRARESGGHGRHVDLDLHFEALEDGVTLARRGTDQYGGLNIRLAPIRKMTLVHHADPAGAGPRMAWQAATGTWEGSDRPLTLAVIEHADNPGYPGDFVQFPELPWFQPTFPRARTRHALRRGEPLVLRYRIWIRRGPPPTEHEFRDQWQAYNRPDLDPQP